MAAEPVNQPPTNPCGPVGAVFAHVLFTTLGWSSWLLLLGLAVVNLLVTTRRPRPRQARTGRRLWARSSSSSPVSFTNSRRRSRPARRSAAADTSGALVAIFLEVHFGPVGMRLILAAAGLFGLALCHDVVFLWPIQEVRALVPAPLAAHAGGKPLPTLRRARPGRPPRPGDWESPG